MKKSKHHGLKRPPCGSEANARRELQAWFSSELGQSLAAEEAEQLETALPTLFGYYLLQIGRGADPTSYLDVSMIKQKIVVGCDNYDISGNVRLRSKPEALAIASDSVDVVILSHVLEFHPDPHQVLREMDRVLVPEGRIIIIGFNPWSLWGARHWFSRWKGENPPWCARFISPFRVKDWLKLLGFDVDVANTFFHKLPIEKRWVMRNSGFLSVIGAKLWPAFGGAYILVAKKRVATLTRIPLKWMMPRPSIKTGLIETRDTNAHVE
jgi:SAM-dependent methyltransferase